MSTLSPEQASELINGLFPSAPLAIYSLPSKCLLFAALVQEALDANDRTTLARVFPVIERLLKEGSAEIVEEVRTVFLANLKPAGIRAHRRWLKWTISLGSPVHGGSYYSLDRWVQSRAADKRLPPAIAAQWKEVAVEVSGLHSELDLLWQLSEAFPELKKFCEDHQFGVALLSFRNHTNEAIERGDFATLLRCYAFVEKYLSRATSSVLREIMAAYLIELKFTGPNGERAREMLPPFTNKVFESAQQLEQQHEDYVQRLRNEADARRREHYPKIPPPYRALVERIDELSGVEFRPATEADVGKLRALGAPETVQAFYRVAEPSQCVQWNVRLWPVSHIIERNTTLGPGVYVCPHGYIVFATTISGDAYCFDCNHVNAAGQPRIVLLSHELFGPDTSREEIEEFTKVIAPDLAKFLQSFIDETLDEDAPV